MKQPEERALGDAELPGLGDVEATEPVLLDERVAEGTSPMLYREGPDLILVAEDRFSRLHLVDADIETHPLDPELDGGPKRPTRAGRAVDGDRILAPLQAHRAHEPGDAQEVIGVEVGDEDPIHAEARGESHHLALRTLAAVEEHGIALSLHEDGAHAAPDRGPGRGSPKEGHSDHGSAR